MRPGRKRDRRGGMSRKHLANLRHQPCVACFKEPAGTVHHLKSETGERGMGLRSTDKWGLPMCPICHEDIERSGTKNERAVFLGWGVDPHALAAQLWDVRDEPYRMKGLIMRHRP